MRRRPRIAWPELGGATVGVWGMGLEGRANLRRATEVGARTIQVDDHPSTPEVQATGDGGLEALTRCDVVVKTPGISRYRPEVCRLEEAGVPVVGGLGLWLEEVLPAPVACVTGTKGKSTTTAICGHLLRRLGYDAGVGGNLGQPPYGLPHHERWIVETSSFQATDVSTSPPVVVVTSLHPDHLDWHGDVETYYQDKLSLCSQPGAACTVANGADEVLRAHASALGPQAQWVDVGHGGPHWSDELGLLGAHNRRNAEMARSCLLALGIPEALDDQALAAAAQGFPGLPSRLQVIDRIGAVDVVDDSLSTNVLPAVAALHTFAGRRVAMIVGGHDRGIDYSELAQALAVRDRPTMLATLPANGPAIRAAVERRTSVVATADFPDIDSATAAALEWAWPDGVVLLSPAAPSFGQFTNYAARSDAFRAAVEAARTALPLRRPPAMP